MSSSTAARFFLVSGAGCSAVFDGVGTGCSSSKFSTLVSVSQRSLLLRGPERGLLTCDHLRRFCQRDI